MNINSEDREVLIKEWEDILLNLYDSDPSFPNSCDMMTRIIIQRIRNLDLLKEFELKFVRGYFVDEEQECDTGEVEDLEHFDILNEEEGYNPCEECTCYFMNQHSYIKLKDKRTGERGILDFTRYQFEHDKFSDWVNCSYNTKEDCVRKLMNIIDFDIVDIEKYR